MGCASATEQWFGIHAAKYNSQTEQFFTVSPPWDFIAHFQRGPEGSRVFVWSSSAVALRGEISLRLRYMTKICVSI